MNIKKINYNLILGLITLMFLINGCAVLSTPDDNSLRQKIIKSTTKKIDKDNYKLNTRNIDKYKFDVDDSVCLKDILIKMKKKAPNINIIIGSDVNLQARFYNVSNLKKITFRQYINFLNQNFQKENKFELKRIGVVYKLSVVKNKKYLNKIKQKKIDKMIKQNIRNFKMMKISFGKAMTFSEIFSILTDNLPNLEIIYDLKDNKDFLNKEIGVDFQGSVYSLLKFISSTYNYNLDLSSGIRFYDTAIKVFTLDIPALNLKPENLKGIQQVDIYDQLKQSLENVILNKNTTINISKSEMTVTVKGSISDIKRISKQIKKFNKTYSKQVNFEVSFYTVSHNQNSKTNVDLLGLVSYLSNKALAKIDSANTFTLNSTSTPTTSDLTSFKLKKNGETDLAIIDYLNKYGNAVSSQSPRFTTLNKIPYVLNMTENRDYVKSIKEDIVKGNETISNGETTKTDDSITKDVKTDTLKTGFKLELLPIIDSEDGTINVILSPNITDLVSMDEYNYQSGVADSNGNYANNMIQLLHTKDFNMGKGQIVRINNGETSLIGGYTYETGSTDNSGLGDNDNSFLNLFQSSKTADKQRVEIIIFITASIENKRL